MATTKNVSLGGAAAFGVDRSNLTASVRRDPLVLRMIWVLTILAVF